MCIRDRLGGNTTADYNTAVGHFALNTNTTGAGNAALGSNALRYATTASFNSSVGHNSGTAIKELIDYFKIDAKDVFVFHDDMDIDFGKIKAKFGGSSAGHNGIESIDKFIGKDYSRVRIGIGHPKVKKKVNNHVLEDFKEDEEEKINEITENIVKQIPTLIDKKMDLFSSKVNQNLNGI